MITTNVGVKFVTWNVTHIAADKAGELFRNLVRWFGRSLIVGLEEVQPGGKNVSVSGWAIATSELCSCALRWPEALRHLMASAVCDECVVGAPLGTVGICTAYLPDSSYGVEYFQSAVNKVRHVRHQLITMHHIKNTVIMGDWNVRIPAVESHVGELGYTWIGARIGSSTHHDTFVKRLPLQLELDLSQAGPTLPNS